MHSFVHPMHHLAADGFGVARQQLHCHVGPSPLEQEVRQTPPPALCSEAHTATTTATAAALASATGAAATAAAAATQALLFLFQVVRVGGLEPVTGGSTATAAAFALDSLIQ